MNNPTLKPAQNPTNETIKTIETPDMDTSSPVSDERDTIIRQYVAGNLGLVRKEANRLACLYGAGEDPETRNDLYNDCLQNGVLGLHRAAELFDESRGKKFSTYAMWWISKLAKEAANAWAEDRRHASLDAPTGEEDDATVGDFVMDEGAEDPSEATDRLLRVEVLRELLDELPARDRAMVEMHYGFHGRPAPFSEIGAAHNVSPQRAERIIKRAIARLRELARERDFDPAA